MLALAGAATDRNRIAADVFGRGIRFSQAVEKHKARRLFDAEPAGLQSMIRKPLRGYAVRTFVFLPCPNFNGPRQEFANAAFFKRGRNEDRFATARNQKSKHALARPPSNPREIEERGPRRDEERRELRLGVGHQLLRASYAGLALAGGDGLDAIADGFERIESWWQGALLRLEGA